MDEIVEGCFKLFFGILFFLAAPVIVVIYAIKAVHWVLVQLAAWWAVHGGVVIEVGVALVVTIVVGCIAVACFKAWWPLHQERQRQVCALRKLGQLHQQTIRRMGDTPGSTTNT
jgi:hypothetical protein